MNFKLPPYDLVLAHEVNYCRLQSLNQALLKDHNGFPLSCGRSKPNSAS